MRSTRSVLIVLPLVVFLTGASVSADQDAAPSPLEPVLTERVEKRLIQFEMRLARRGAPVRGLSEKDLDIELGGMPLKNFTVDDMCGDSSVVAPVTRLGSSIFYFDDPELTREGRIRAVEVARLVAPALLGHGHDLLILHNGASVRAETTWTHDAAEVSAALDRIAEDSGERDHLRDDADEQDVERLIDQANDQLGVNARGSAALATRTPYDCKPPARAKREEIAAQHFAGDMVAINGLAAALKHVVADELRRAGRDFERLRGAVQLLSLRGSPKSLVYFADSLRSDPGRAMAAAFESVAKLDTTSSYHHPRSSIATWNADGAMQSLVRDASTYGARIYAVEGRGLTARSDWVRTAQDTLASLALDTGGLSFLNGLPASVIADRVAADQSCWYLVSFDSSGWAEDRPLGIGVWPKRQGLRVNTISSLVIPGRDALIQARLMAAHFGDRSQDDQPLSVSIYPVGGTDKRLQVMAQVLLPESQQPHVRDTILEVGLQVVSQGAVVSHTSNRVTWSGNGAAPVYQTTLSLPTGPYEIVAVVRDVGTDSIRQGRVGGTWPAVTAERVTLSLPALAQPKRSGVVVDGEVNPHGIVVRGTGDPVDPREALGMVTAACIQGSEDVVFRAERSIVGGAERSFAPMTLGTEKGRCVQIRDMVPAGSLAAGRMTYLVRILSGDRTITSQELVFDVADVAAVPQSPIAAATH